jgi:hypothetical protein
MTVLGRPRLPHSPAPHPSEIQRPVDDSTPRFRIHPAAATHEEMAINR